MYAPVRAGTRGGQGDFKWSDVTEDKDRENYLGHSILAPKGRWQNNRDITWYNKDQSTASVDAVEEARKAEIRAIKEAEEDALSLALGFTPAVRPPPGTVASTSTGGTTNGLSDEAYAIQKAEAKELRKLEKEERKADRATRREERRSAKPKKEERSRGGERERWDEGRGDERDSRRDEPPHSRHRERDDRDSRDSRREPERGGGERREGGRGRDERDRSRSPVRR